MYFSFIMNISSLFVAILWCMSLIQPMLFQKMTDSTASDIYIDIEKAIVRQRIGTFTFQLEEEVIYSIIPIKDACIIRLARKFLRFFLNFPRIVKKVLEVSILWVYKGGTNFFRTITKSWIWTLIKN